MGKEIKIGHERRPAPVVPTNVPLYNQQTGQVLRDAGGTILVSQEDTVLTTETSSAKASPVVFTDEKTNNKTKNKLVAGSRFSATGNKIREITTPNGMGNFLSDLDPGDKLLLPTGLEGSKKVYEPRTILSIESQNELTLAQPVTANVALFGQLIKMETIKVDPNWKVVEQFPEASETSSTILGYPKAETQLGLFSNVSTYGLSDDEFLFYRNDGSVYEPSIWANRKNRTYGNHYRSNYVEEKEESAISLRSFRVPYSYPWTPSYEYSYNQEKYQRFNNFLKVGMLLYEQFKNDPSYSQNFLPYIANHCSVNNIVYGDNELQTTFQPGEQVVRTDTTPNQVIGTVLQFRRDDNVLHFNEDIGYIFTNNSKVNVPIKGLTSNTIATINSDLTFNDPIKCFSNLVTPLNPYYSDAESFFAQIDTWTETWRDIRKNIFNLPNGSLMTVEYVNTRPLIQSYIINPLEIDGNIMDPLYSFPGYDSAQVSRAYLESRKAFRYQPGRISGYTFGVRASSGADLSNVFIEWGIGNDTDDLLFQINGPNFSIVRRSVVPLPNDVLAQNNLEPSDQKLITKDTITNASFTDIEPKQVYEIVVPSQSWNGDPLDGNGPSGWDWSSENVTMYKIEFGWYGAIGVQFYAYVPIGNNEARWVKLHRLIIENKLKQPCMGDPYYKFKYSLIIRDHGEVRSPQYIYKYGTSCYIDGGDEGTVLVGARTSEVKNAPIETIVGNEIAKNSTTLLAIQPKTVIYNSLGKAIKNKKAIYPRELSVNSSGLTELSIVKCKGCPGYGYVYQPNLTAGEQGTKRQLAFPPGNRGSVELPVLQKTCTGNVNTNIITVNNTDFLRVGDIVDRSNEVEGIPENTIIEEIDGNQITISNNLTEQLNGVVEFQPVFLQKDFFSKVIASRIWNTYIWNFEQASLISIPGQELRYTQAKLATVDSAESSGLQNLNATEYLRERIIPETYRLGNGIIQNYPTQFPARLSQYTALAASGIPIIGRKNSILFMVPNYGADDTGTYSNGQYADWRVGVTTLKPVPDGTGGITWFDNQGNEREFTEQYKLYAERFAEGIDRDEDGYETGETSFSRVPPFTVDYRIPSPGGSNSGRCSYLDIVVNDAVYMECKQIHGSELIKIAKDPEQNSLPITNAYPDFDVNAWYLIKDSFPFTFNPENGEIGFDPNDPQGITTAPNVGSGVYFKSDVRNYVTIVNSNPVPSKFIKISEKLYNVGDNTTVSNITVWYIPVSIDTYRKIATKSLNYNPFPLYFFVETRDFARLNGAVLKEQGQVTNTYNPKWIVTNGMQIDNADIEVGPIDNTTTTTGNLEDSPPNFVDNDRLSSALVDIQNQAQLRPYEVVDTLYVGQDTKTLSLKNIFDYTKESITPDLLNTTAYFIIATSKENTSTEVQATLNYIEQQ